jgi:hypothetical protein
MFRGLGACQKIMSDLSALEVFLGGLVVIVFAIGLEVHGFRPNQGRWIFLRAIKFRSTTFFGEEAKQSASCRKVLRYVKDHCGV